VAIVRPDQGNKLDLTVETMVCHELDSLLSLLVRHSLENFWGFGKYLEVLQHVVPSEDTASEMDTKVVGVEKDSKRCMMPLLGVEGLVGGSSTAEEGKKRQTDHDTLRFDHWNVASVV